MVIISHFPKFLSYLLFSYSSERPVHGKLNEYSTFYDHVTYTPAPEYCGMDFFTYHMVAGSLLTAPATVAIRIVDPDNPNVEFDTNQNNTRGDRRTRLFNRNRGNNNNNNNYGDIESQSSTSTSPRRPPWRRVSSNSSPNPQHQQRDSELNPGIELIYDNRKKDSVPNQTPFMDNLLRKTSGPSSKNNRESENV